MALPLELLPPGVWRLLLLSRLTIFKVLENKLLVFSLVIHWLTCLWKVAISQEEGWVPPKDRDRQFPLDHSYLSSLYYTLLSLVAANDPMPSSPLELVLACTICLGGSLATGILVGEFAASFS